MRNGTQEPARSREKPDDTTVLGYEDNGTYAYADGPPIEESGLPEEERSYLRNFYTTDAFTCEGDGRPVWCSTCLNYKPDSEWFLLHVSFNKLLFALCSRDGQPVFSEHTCFTANADPISFSGAHHCREVGRCVRKMDHFCPW